MCIIIWLSISKFINTSLLEIQMVEWVWTIIPAFLLLQIALPSLLLLYIMDEASDAEYQIKAIGHQWFWEYDYVSHWSDGSSSESLLYTVNYESYMLPAGETWDEFRLLDVDCSMVLPVGVPIRVLITSADVLHSWTVPSLGVKADAIPGRLNQVKFSRYRPGFFFGQCSEICGANHRFMPIVVECISRSEFDWWIDVIWLLTG